MTEGKTTVPQRCFPVPLFVLEM